MALEKASLTNTVTGDRVNVLFNPEEYTLNRDINYAQAAIPGLSAPLLQFVNGNMQTLEMELFVDTLRGPRQRSRPAPTCARRRAKVADLMNIDADHARAAGAAVHLGLAHVHLRARPRQPALHHVPPGRHAGPRAPAGDVQRVPQRRARGEGGQARDGRLLEAPHRRPGRDALGDRRVAPTATRPSGGRSRSATASTTRARCPLGLQLAIPPLPFRDPDSGEVFA